MPELLSTIALFYDDDAYTESRHDPGRSRDEDRPVGLMGRQVAGKEFLKAYLDHGAWTELVASCPQQTECRISQAPVARQTLESTTETASNRR